jgi:hypothetical protein
LGLDRDSIMCYSADSWRLITLCVGKPKKAKGDEGAPRPSQTDK